MRTRCRRLRAGVALAALLPGVALAAVTADEAAQLGNALTPVGAIAAANAEGSIPAWTGGLVEAPPCYAGPGHRYCNPFPDDKPVAIVTAANLDAWRARLSAGQQALLEKYPETYKLPVYATRRSFANPPALYQGALRNATGAHLSADTLAISGAVAGVPFPIPKSGAEAMWNHRLRYRGEGLSRWNVQLAVATSGEFTLARWHEDLRFAFAPPSGAARIDTLAHLREPSRLAGTVVLMREALDDPGAALKAWEFAPGEKKLHRAPSVGYDNPAPGSDGLRTIDQDDVFSGPLDRYDFKLIGRRELLVPANSYELHGDAHRYKDLVRKGHLNQDLARYELRRVWRVEATLKKGVTHLYPRRTLYLDEDGWQLRLVDDYGADGELWRVQEGHTVVAYDRPYEMPVCETVYDLASGRYLAQALNNEEPETTGQQYQDSFFDVSSASKLIAR